MAYVTPATTYNRVNFLAANEFTSFTELVDPANAAVVTRNGRRILPAGTIYPLNDATAKGIVLTDTDVTYGAQPAPLVVEAYVLQGRLPVAPAAAAITALKEIKFQ